jgi:hypothetical protein
MARLIVLLCAVMLISVASCRVLHQAERGPVQHAAANDTAVLRRPVSSPIVDANDTKAVAGNTTAPGPFTALLAKAPFNTSLKGNASLMATMADRIAASELTHVQCMEIWCAGRIWFAKLPSLRCSFTASKTADEALSMQQLFAPCSSQCMPPAMPCPWHSAVPCYAPDEALNSGTHVFPFEILQSHQAPRVQQDYYCLGRWQPLACTQQSCHAGGISAACAASAMFQCLPGPAVCTNSYHRLPLTACQAERGAVFSMNAVSYSDKPF